MDPGPIVPPSSPSIGLENGPFECVKKLTHTQVKRGWREAYSASEKRPYYYNVFTRESLWAIPTVQPAQQEESQADSGPAPDLLAAAMAELSGKPPMKLAEPPFIKGKPGKKRKFSPDPEQEENDRNAVRFHIGESTNQDIVDRRARARRLTKRILTKLITDEILRLVYRAQEQLGCEGCEEDWTSQWDHACLFFGVNPENRIDDFMDEHFDEAIQSLDTGRVLPMFHAVAALLGASSFSGEGVDLNAEINPIIADILTEWKADQSDIGTSFYTMLFDNTTELVQYTINLVE
ncbi:uncharacterized protein LOC119730560 [Patiria miniata]|uniref:WW domain-containing protein n=1 Tax=Patiria miniata TaxID=46514 RepID=A0A914A4A9_PATMI|nr:uncharacterized protein LOC119729968 [Patiria miniata]XP_038059462.1 uncharacterized protein LOC119730560 [Patiria miniata]